MLEKIQVERIVRAVEKFVPALDDELIEALEQLRAEVKAA